MAVVREAMAAMEGEKGGAMDLVVARAAVALAEAAVVGVVTKEDRRTREEL